MTPFGAIVTQLAAARRPRAEPSPEIKSNERSMQQGSGTSKVLECVENAESTITSAEVVRITGLDRKVVATALNWLVGKKKIERANKTRPYLYRGPE